jgi:hypothetical protein
MICEYITRICSWNSFSIFVIFVLHLNFETLGELKTKKAHVQQKKDKQNMLFKQNNLIIFRRRMEQLIPVEM